MILFLVSILFTVATEASSVLISPPVMWSGTYGGGDDDSLFSLAIAKDGNPVLAGRSSSLGLPGKHDPWYFFDYYVVKPGVWSRCFGGSLNDVAKSCAPTMDGGTIIAGITNSKDGDVTGHDDWILNNTAPQNNAYPWVIKVDQYGVLEWQKCPGEYGNEFRYGGDLVDIQQTTDGRFIGCGWGRDGGNLRGAVVRLDRKGDTEWIKFPLSSSYSLTSIQETSDGGFITGGHWSTRSGNEVTPYSCVGKLDRSGNKVWDQPWEAGGILKIRETKDKGFIALGTDRNRNAQVIKLDGGGRILSKRSFGGSDNEGFNYLGDIQQTKDGGYIFTITSQSRDGDLSGLVSAGSEFFIWVVKLRPSLDIVWQKAFENVGQNGVWYPGSFGAGVAQAGDGGYFVAGQNNYNLGDPGIDYYLAKLGSDEHPSINKIDIEPSVPVTRKDFKASAQIKNIPGWQVTGLKWDLVYWKPSAPAWLSSIVFSRGSNTKIVNPLTYFPSEGLYGNYKVICYLYGKELSRGGPSILCDKKTLDFKVFFKMVEDDSPNWQTDPTTIPHWTSDWGNPGMGLTRMPNWFRYWQQDKAVDGMEQFSWNGKIGAGQYYPQSRTYEMGPQAASYWALKIIETKMGTESLGGTLGLDTVASTVSHEFRHHDIRNSWGSGGLFSGTTDSDREGDNNDHLPDDFENGTLVTSWEPLGSKTLWNNTDTYNFSTLFDNSYKTYGDEEYLCYRAERAYRDARKNPLNDWSNYGYLAKEQGILMAATKGTGSVQSPLKQASIGNTVIFESGSYSGPAGINISSTDVGVDTNGNGLYEQLNAQIGVNVNLSRRYVIHGWLTDDTGKEVTSTSWSGYLDPGSYGIPLLFSGSEIAACRIPGPYNLTVRLYSAGGRDLFEIERSENLSITKPYLVTDFEGSQVSFTGPYQETALDANNDGVYEALRVNGTLQVTIPGTYLLTASLTNGTTIITSEAVELSLTPGTTTPGFVFDGLVIGASGLNGPYHLAQVMVQNADGLVLNYTEDAYMTGVYSYTQFLPTGMTITGGSDQGIDLNSNGKYDKLIVAVGVNATTAGTYSVSGSLLDSNGTTISDVTREVAITAGAQEVRLVVDGNDIFRSGKAGPYTLATFVIMDSGGNVAALKSQAHTTGPYLSTAFDGLPVSLTGTASDAGEDTDGSGKFDNLTVTIGLHSDSAGTFSLSAGLLGPDGFLISGENHEVVFSANETANVVFRFSGKEIGMSGQSGEFEVVDLVVTDTSTGDVFYEPEVCTAGPYSSGDFDSPGMITGTVTSVFGYPVSGASVGIEEMVWSSTGDDGRYSLPVERGGSYLIAVEVPPHYNLTNASANITITPGQIITRDFILGSTGASPPVISMNESYRTYPGIVTFYIYGNNFTQNPSVRLVHPGVLNITPAVIALQTTKITARVNVTGAAPGLYNITVINPDGQSATAYNKFEIYDPSVPVPVVNFTANRTQGLPPLTIQFNDTSAGNVTSWSWLSNGVFFSNEQNPVRTFTGTGSYNIKLNTWNAGGFNYTEKSSFITVVPFAPVANFTAAPVTGPVPLTVQFTSSSNGTPTSWIWDFGDGSNSTIVSPSHVYTANGTFNVSLTVGNAGGNHTLIRTAYINVTLPAPGTPVISAINPKRIVRGQYSATGFTLYGSNFSQGISVNLSREGRILTARNITVGYPIPSSLNGILDLPPDMATGAWNVTAAQHSLVSNSNVTVQVYGEPSSPPGWVFHADAGHTGGYDDGGAQPAATLQWSSPVGGEVWSSPAYSSGMVFVGCDNGVFSAFNVSSGAEIWSQSLGAAIRSSPAVMDGRVYLGDDSGLLHALDASSGSQIWTTDLGGEIRSSPVVAYGSIFVGSTSGTLFAVDRSSGGMLWYYETGGPVRSSPAVSGGKVYVSDGGGTISCVDAMTGNGDPVYISSTPISSSPVLAGGSLFFGNELGELISWALSPGGSGWSHQLSGASISSTPAVVDGKVYVGDLNGRVFALYQATGNIAWSTDIGGGIEASPAVAGGTVYIGSGNSLLYALNAANGNVRWSYTTGGELYSSPAVALGKVFVGSLDGNLYAIGSETPEIPESPRASFTADTYAGPAPLDVQFSDTSTGLVTSWNWSFGDGAWFNTTAAGERNASYTYTTPGIFSAQLTVSYMGGTNTSTGTMITVNQASPVPVASFIAAPLSGPAPLLVRFNDTSTGNPAMWNWSFGDGTCFNTTIALERNISHVYSLIGTYRTNLTVRNAGGINTTDDIIIIVQDNMMPTITSLTPSSATVGAGAFNLTIVGTNFTSGSIVTWNGGDRTTYYTSATSLKAWITAADLTSAGRFPVQVRNGPGVLSNIKTFNVTNQEITSIKPAEGPNTATLSTVTITGTGFETGSTVTLTNAGFTIPGTVTFQNNTTIRSSFPLTGSPTRTYDLNIRAPDGLTATLPAAFTVTNATPVIATIIPSSGFNTGTLPVTITGTAFRNGFTVSLVNGSTTITGTITNRTTTRILATFPLTGTTPGMYNLTVLNIDGTSGTKQNAFTVISPVSYPTITGFTPVSGVNTGTVPVIITGTNFRTGASVTITFNTTTKTISGTVTSTTTIKASLPLTGLPTGLYNLTIRNTDGSFVTRENEFTITSPTPVIASVIPLSGYTTGPVSVTISGSKFGSGAVISLDNATFSLPGSVTSFSTTKITGTFALGSLSPGTYNLTVTNPGGPKATKPFTVSSPVSYPTFTGFTPVSGVNTGTVPVTINGTNFRTGASVTITNKTTTKTLAGTVTGTTTIKVSLPLTGLPFGTYNLTVRNIDGSSVTRENEFTVHNPAPLITSVNPSSGYTTGPLSVTISGSKFVSGVGLSLDNATSTVPGTVTSFSTTKIIGTFVLGSLSPGSFNLTVTNPGGPNATKPFTVSSPVSYPTITGFTPVSGVNTGLVPVTITGANFRSGASVTITNGSTMKTVAGTLTGSTVLKCSLPLTGLPYGLYNLTVCNIDGSSVTRESEFTVHNPTPRIASVNPSSGYTTGPATVTISGSEFVSGARLSLDNATSSLPGSVTSFSTTKITGTFTLGSLPPGTYNLTVTSPGGLNATKPFTVISPVSYPTITSFTPVFGMNTGLVPVTITGTNFRTGASVTITNNTTTKTSAGTVTSTTTIKASLLLTGLPYGLYNLTVRNTDGSSVTRESEFTVHNPAPLIVSVSPSSGYMTGPVTVTISGSKFVPGAVISLDNATSTIPGTVTSFSATKITGTFALGSLSPGSYNLTVSNPGNANGTIVSAFIVQAPGTAPVISTVIPSSGFNNWNLPVMITGSNYRTAKVYLYQGSLLKLATPIAGKASTATTLYVTLPLTGVPGGLYNLTVSNSDGVNVTRQDIFYVTDQAWISKGPKAGARPVVQKPEVPMIGSITGGMNRFDRPAVRGEGEFVPVTGK